MTKIEKRICLWLLICAGMVLIMIGIGGYTRLSGSGLSIVDWKPLMGAIPPLSEASWVELFERYQLFPEYQKVNNTMTLAEFKVIYFVEYFHRLWGRAMGLALLVPTLYAAFSYRSLLPRLLSIWLLAGAQGFMGWYMVASGLVDDPHVSPYRLTMHLLLAIAILAMLLKTIFDLRPAQVAGSGSLAHKYLTLAMLLGLTICFGGLTAGTKAGWIYNTFPDMNGHVLPEEIFTLHPFWLDIVANPATIQFFHRTLAFLTLAMGVYVFLASRDALVSSRLKHVSLMIAFALSMQVVLGVITLVLQVPIWMGVAHQMWAAIAFSATFWGFLLARERRVDHPVALANV